jgi:tRNA pseudouridine38-40 synthase
VAHLDLGRSWAADDLLRALARQLPGDVACTGVATVAADWHACHHTAGKSYSYRIDNGLLADPFRTRFAWRPPFRLDLAALQAASATIPGRRDWRGFSRRGEYREDLVRTIAAMTWTGDADTLRCTVSGDGFTYHLVRSLIGTAVAVANGTCSAADLERTLAGEDTPAGHQQAPAHGLWLERVLYAEEPAWVTAP